MYDYRSDALEQVEWDEFEVTSTHRNWRGKIKCLHCKATGYAGSVQRNPYWWGQHHGQNCKHKVSVN